MDESHQVAGVLADQLRMVFLSDYFPPVLLQDRLFFDAQLFKATGEARDALPRFELDSSTVVGHRCWEIRFQVHRSQYGRPPANDAKDLVGRGWRDDSVCRDRDATGWVEKYTV